MTFIFIWFFATLTSFFFSFFYILLFLFFKKESRWALNKKKYHNIITVCNSELTSHFCESIFSFAHFHDFASTKCQIKMHFLSYFSSHATGSWYDCYSSRYCVLRNSANFSLNSKSHLIWLFADTHITHKVGERTLKKRQSFYFDFPRWDFLFKLFFVIVVFLFVYILLCYCYALVVYFSHVHVCMWRDNHAFE